MQGTCWTHSTTTAWAFLFVLSVDSWRCAGKKSYAKEGGKLLHSTLSVPCRKTGSKEIIGKIPQSKFAREIIHAIWKDWLDLRFMQDHYVYIVGVWLILRTASLNYGFLKVLFSTAYNSSHCILPTVHPVFCCVKFWKKIWINLSKLPPLTMPQISVSQRS